MDRNDEPAGLGINGVIPGAGRCVVCQVATPADRLMCFPHWRLVSNDIKTRLRAVMNRWYRDGATLGELRDIQWEAVESIPPEREDAR